jgi:hypothetical protein
MKPNAAVVAVERYMETQDSPSLDIGKWPAEPFPSLLYRTPDKERRTPCLRLFPILEMHKPRLDSLPLCRCVAGPVLYPDSPTFGPSFHHCGFDAIIH